ncbi:MAG: PP2C family protein-serine/threonine phosphatase [Terracidiphilus sp.]
MRKLFVLPALVLTLAAAAAFSQSADLQAWPNGFLSPSGGWRTQAGDNPSWAQPGVDDARWPAITLGNEDANSAGWRWYRLSVDLPPQPDPLALLITGGDGTFEVYVNGRRLPGPALRSSLLITYPKARIMPIGATGRTEIALRTFVPSPTMFLADRGAFRVLLGTPSAIENAKRAEQSDRLGRVVTGFGVHLLLFLAAAAFFLLFWYQRDRREYLYLGLNLLLVAVGTIAFELATAGAVPFSLNWFVAVPTVYFSTIAQIEFTFSFIDRRVARPWRIYEMVLLIPPAFLVLPAWFGLISRGLFNVDEILMIVPAAILLPLMLLAWYRRGNREAGWLILPSLLPMLSIALSDVGIIGAYLGWPRIAALGDPIPLGILSIESSDICDLLFLLAIGIVMFFRFTRVSRQQARAAAELEAAQRVQSLLLHSAQNAASSLRIHAVYRPAEEVGGDFFHTAQIAGVARVVVGDVSGKGLGAAMLVSAVIGALDTMHDADPVAVLRALNQLLLVRQQGGFATCLCASVSPDGLIAFANAGHLAPYCNGEELPLESGLPLGVTGRAEYSQTAWRLSAGNTLTFLSDGVVEAQSATGELFGFDRTARISMQSAEQIAAAAQAHGQQDDITVLTLTFAGEPTLRARSSRPGAG